MIVKAHGRQQTRVLHRKALVEGSSKEGSVRSFNRKDNSSSRRGSRNTVW